MGKPPALVIIVRHGARLDAADRQWHLTSPTPYDPPLTYGGWKQAQALGGRIATILHSRETTSDTHVQNGVLGNPALATLNGLESVKEGSHGHKSQPARRRKQRLIIHSSPFLRCVQTSIALSAGLEQYQGLHETSQESSNPKSHPHSHPHHNPFPHQMHSASPRLRAMDHWHSPYLSAILEPEENDIETIQKPLPKLTSTPKARLRVDAFLGEWLSPDYFEEITAPPDSVMMIASAKADLLRQGERVEVFQTTSKSTLSRGNFPGGWGGGKSMASDSTEDDEDEPLRNMSDLSQSLPRISRSNTHTGSGPLEIQASQNTVTTEKVISDAKGYTPPTPAYAISPADPIPLGYVAHARDACVDVDYQWDSMRLPHDWGDGGSIGEEWSSMHKRFRRGLHNMISWYRNCDTRTGEESIRGDARSQAETNAEPNQGNEEETETILVLVTHGAGCNALIGALTNQPVLMNVGMASLTMAVRKENSVAKFSPSSSSSDVSPPRRRSIIDLGIAEDYDVKIIASTDHLRPPSHLSPASLTQRSQTTSSSYIPGNRYRSGSLISTGSGRSTSDGGFSLDHDDAESVTAAAPTGLWTKPITQPTEPNRLSRSTQHLYTSHRARKDETTCVPADGQLESSKGKQDGLAKNEAAQPLAVNSPLPVDGEGDRFATQPGLWGTPPVALGTARGKGLKRRWTHSEQR